MTNPKFHADGRCTCGHPPQPDIYAPGYGVRKDGTTYCIDCLTEQQRDRLIREGSGKLIFDNLDGLVIGIVTNEARTLRFDVVHVSDASHNIVQNRRDIWFIGPDEMRWQGTSFGPGLMNVRRCTGLNQLREQLRQVGVSLYLRDGEYRVNLRHGPESSAYYTNDPVDAYRHGLKMAEERDAPKPIAMDW